MAIFFVEVNLDEHCPDLVTDGSKRCTISNPETLIGTITHQGAWEVMALTSHDVNCLVVFLTSSNLQTFQKIKMSDESFVEKPKRIIQKKEK
jgi:hypothetical protein